MIQRFLWGTLYGLAFMFITGTLLFNLIEEWPTNVMWLKIGAGLAAQFGLGVFTYMRDPEGAWRVPPSLPIAGFKRVLLVAFVLGLSACATTDLDLQLAYAKVQTFTHNDAQAAIKIATGPDPANPRNPAGIQCYTWIDAQIGRPLPNVTPIAGILSTWEAAHLVLGSGQSILEEWAEQLNLHCAARFNQSIGTVGKLLLELGVK